MEVAVLVLVLVLGLVLVQCDPRCKKADEDKRGR
jgi:hypothetical protein